VNAAMTSRERILAAMRHDEVDHVPCSITFNPLTPVLRKGHTWNFPWSEDASREEQMAYQVERLGLDQIVYLHIDLCRPLSGVTSRVWLEGNVLHKTYTTPVGELHAAIKYNDLWPHGKDIDFYSDYNIGHFLEPWICNEADLACFKQVRALCDTADAIQSARDLFASAKRLADQYQLATFANAGTGLTGAMQLFGSSELCLMTHENPALVDAYLEHEHQINLRAIELLSNLGMDILGRNGFYETADFYSADTLERFLGKRLRFEADSAKVSGMLTRYTINTGVMPILDYLASLTTDSFFGIDIAFEGVDFRAIRDRLAPGKSFWIGPSSVYHTWNGPERTRHAVRDVFDVLGRRGLILAPCVSAHSIMPWESTLALIEEWRIHR